MIFDEGMYAMNILCFGLVGNIYFDEELVKQNRIFIFYFFNYFLMDYHLAFGNVS